MCALVTVVQTCALPISAPIWAGLAAVMNQYLLANGGRLIGDLNPQLYRMAESAPLPAFRDVTLGGNVVADAGPGYDLVTGLGTPTVDNRVRKDRTSVVEGKSGSVRGDTEGRGVI